MMNPLKKNILLLLIFTLIVNPKIWTQTRVIPFTYEANGRIILQYQIKGIPLKLFFDTGSNSNSIDFKSGEKLNIFPKDSKRITLTTIGNVPYEIAFIKQEQDTQKYLDSIFCCPTNLTDMTVFSRLTKNKDIYDGLMGKTFVTDNYVIEFDFEKNQVLFWDSIPNDYIDMHHGNVETVRLVSTDYGSDKQGIPNGLHAIHGKLTLVDSLVFETNFMLDTGSHGYLILITYDKDLLNKMSEFREKKMQKYGNDVKTIRLDIKELGIDSMLSKVRTMDRSKQMEEKYTTDFGAYKIGGLLGMEFFRQYKRVLLDGKNKIGYFIQ